MSEGLFIPKNAIETYKEFQWGISMAHPEVAVELAKQAQDIVGDVRKVYNSSKLIIHAMSGYILNRQLTIDEQIPGYQFDELTLIGHLGGFPYIQKLENPRLQTFMVDMYDVRIIDPVLEENPGGKITPAVMIPVLDVESVMVAA